MLPSQRWHEGLWKLGEGERDRRGVHDGEDCGHRVVMTSVPKVMVMTLMVHLQKWQLL